MAVAVVLPRRCSQSSLRRSVQPGLLRVLRRRTSAAALLSAIEAASDTVASVGLAPEGEIGTDTFGSLFADEYAIDD